MTQECPSLGKCGFFNKYQSNQNHACKSFIQLYCKGEKQTVCKRMEYKQAHGHPPVDDMMPSGQIFHVRVVADEFPMPAQPQPQLQPKKSWWQFWK